MWWCQQSSTSVKILLGFFFCQMLLCKVCVDVARTISGTIRWRYTHVDVCFVSQREALVTIVLFTNTIRSVLKHRIIWISPHNFATFIQSISEWKKWSFSYETTRVRWLILTCPVKWQVKPWRNGFLSSISHYIALLFLSISSPTCIPPGSLFTSAVQSVSHVQLLSGFQQRLG